MDNWIIANRIRCKKCRDIVESLDCYDCVFCSCETVAACGGAKYLVRIGHPTEYKELSILNETEPPVVKLK